MSDEEKDLNKFPVHQDIVVLSADDCKQLKLGWTVKEYTGFEIFKFDNEGKIVEESLLNEDDIFVGLEIAVYVLGGYAKMIVEQSENGELCARSQNCLSCLKFNKDDRQCWISSCIINLRGLKKANKNTIIE